MSTYVSFYPNRLICTVLEEMRKCHETRNYAYLPGLIEEAQTLANRMEAKLEDNKDIKSAHERKRELKEDIKELEKQLEQLEKEKEKK